MPQLNQEKGSVFFESYPLTKLDTQIAARSSKRVACAYLDKECNDIDIFYQIRANSSIVGGPSAGAATTLATILALQGTNKKHIAMTGTINDGGLIGTVGGIPEKILAAVEQGAHIILVPAFSAKKCLNESNQSKRCESYPPTLKEFINDDTLKQVWLGNSRVVKVLTIDEAIEEVTGKKAEINGREHIDVPPVYNVIMEEVSEELCKRRDELHNKVKNELFNITLERHENKTRDIEKATKDEAWYAKASFCFSDNLMLRSIDLKNTSQSELYILYKEIREGLERERAILEGKSVETITDLETYNIVSDRIHDAEKILLDLNTSDLRYADVAYAEERFMSVIAWKRFFNTASRPYAIDQDQLSAVCEERIKEAEELLDFLLLAAPDLYAAVEPKIEDAQEAHDRGEHARCFFQASKAKADALAYSLMLSITIDQREVVVDKVLDIASGIIQTQAEKNRFPIMGYSYYVYADRLKEQQPSTALIYAEYAVELSQLDMYFPSPNGDALNHIFSLRYIELILMQVLLFMNAFLFLYLLFGKRD